MRFKLIGDDLYYGDFKLATLNQDLLPSVRVELEEYLCPYRPPTPTQKRKPK